MKTISTERLTLRPLAPEDSETVVRYHGIPDISRYQGWEPETEAEIHALVDRMRSADFLAPDQWFQFAIVWREDAALIGDCGVHADSKESRQVEVGITVTPEFQKRGVAFEALSELLDHLFADTNTHRVCASIDPRNGPSLRLFEKLGFRKEAHHVESLWFKGEWADDVIFALLRREWAMNDSTRFD